MTKDESYQHSRKSANVTHIPMPAVGVKYP